MGNVKKIVAPIVGMTFFWAYFRYQAVFGTLYPLGSEVSVFGYGIQLYTVFLIEALVLSVIALFFFKKSGGCYSLGKRVVLASSIIGTMGAVLNMCVQAGVFDAVVFWLSILLTVIGFLGNYLAWTQYFSSSFGAKHLVLLAISYFMSIVLLTALSLSFASMKPLLTTMTPLIVGLSWCLAQPQGRIPKQKRSKPSGSKKWINQTTTLYIGLYIAFLLAGSVVRGIIDTGYSSESVPYLRWVISIGVSGLILAACVWYWFKTKHGIDGNGEAAGSKPLSMAKRMSIGRLTLVCWMVLALLFFSGMFASLIFGSYVEGGHIVVVARSSLDFFLWVLLCDIATKGRIPPVPLFLVCGILTEVASWLVSYVMVPGVLGSSPDEGLLSLETLVLMVLFSLMAFVVVAFGVLALRKQPNSSDKALDSAANSAARVPSERVSEYKLTQREVEVIQLFSQGYSLTKVADELFISKSTAQTHAKSIYRKLDIHSKNELIGKMKEWTNAQ